MKQHDIFGHFACRSILLLAFVLSGSCSDDDSGPAFVPAPSFFNFEDGTLPGLFIPSGDKPWEINPGGASFSLRSGDIRSSGNIITWSHTNTCFMLHVANGKSVNFDPRAAGTAVHGGWVSSSPTLQSPSL